MSDKQEKRRADEVPPKPEFDALPKPRVLWQGVITEPLGESPARVVLTYVWTMPAGSKSWVAEPTHVLEVARKRDAMGELQYEVAQLTSLPAAFFEAYLSAVGRKTP